MTLLQQFILPRLLQWVIVIIVGVTVTFLIPRLSPVNPVQDAIARLTQFAMLEPEAVLALRTQLEANFGLEGTIIEQYIRFWANLLNGDLGPSFGAFPRSVNDIIGTALPYTAALLTFTTILGWIIGIIIGTLAAYYPGRATNIVSGVLVVIYPIPYFIIAFIFLMALTYYIPFFPLIGVFRGEPGFNAEFIGSYLHSTFLPAITLLISGLSFRFIMARALGTAELSSDHVQYATMAGLPDRRLMTSYVARNTMLPQVTDLGLGMGAIFSGALITEAVFGYPGLGDVLVQGIYQADYNVVMGVVILSIVGIATASLIVDLCYPLLDPRVRYR